MCSLELPVEQAGLTLGAFLWPLSPDPWLSFIKRKSSEAWGCRCVGKSLSVLHEALALLPRTSATTGGDASRSSLFRVLREENEFKVILNHLVSLKSAHAIGDCVSKNKKENNSNKGNIF